jgi:hypothetical protein
MPKLPDVEGDLLVLRIPWNESKVQGVRIINVADIGNAGNREIARVVNESISDGESKDVWMGKGAQVQRVVTEKVALARSMNSAVMEKVKDIEDRRTIALVLVKQWGAANLTPDTAVANSCGWTQRKAMLWIGKEQ